MPKKVWYLASIILLVCIISIIAVGIFLVVQWNRPLGSVLMIPTPTSTIQPELKQSTVTATEDSLSSAVGESTSTATLPTEPIAFMPTQIPATATASPLCGGPDYLYILAAGLDNSFPDYRYGRADVIRIIRVDFRTPKVSVLTLPRDLWVELPGIKEEYEDLTHAKINTAFFYGAPALDRYKGEGGGPGLLAHTIAHNYGLYVDNYVVVNMLAFEQFVDALGGIDIYLHQTWDGRADKEADHYAWVFEEGQHHMTGAEALRFARIRLGYSEIIRTDNQSLVLCAIKEKLQRPHIVTSIPNIATAFLGKIQTDLTPAQISQLICLLPKLDRDNIQFVRFPADALVSGRTYDPMGKRETFVWDIPVSYIREFMIDFIMDDIPLDAPGGGSQRCPQ